MRIIVLLLSLLAARPAAQPLSPENKVLMDGLAAKFDSLDVYRTGKLAEIQSLKDRAAGAASERERVLTYMDVASEYRHYNSDSALVYLEKARSLADSIGDRAAYVEAGINSAEILTIVGYYKECCDRLDEIGRKNIPREQLYKYYEVQELLHYELFHIDGSRAGFGKLYRDKYYAYMDSVIYAAPPMSECGLRSREKKALKQGDLDAAMQFNLKRMEIAAKGTVAESLVYYERSIIYDRMPGHHDDVINCLLRSAIIDLENYNQDVGSFNNLVTRLVDVLDSGMLDKMSRYSYETIIQFHTRTRRLIGMDMIKETDNILRQQLVRQKRQLSLSFVLLSVLAALLIAALCYMVVLIRRGRMLNRSLERSNSISNSYIVSFFELYSSYINRLTAFRSRVNTSLRRGNTDYVIALTNPDRDITNEELRHMYDSFDKAFLDIFPTFIEDVNALLKPECRIVVKEPSKLNTELRIFAMIRLGITDSPRISELLHYSIKTVYNKRSSINSKLAVPRGEFEEFLMNNLSFTAGKVS